MSWWSEIEHVFSALSAQMWFLFLWWSFSNLPWCQRHGSFSWIHSHWNIEQHLNLRSVVLADKKEHSNNPTRSGGSSSYAATLTWQTHHEVQVLPKWNWMKLYKGLPVGAVRSHSGLVAAEASTRAEWQLLKSLFPKAVVQEIVQWKAVKLQSRQRPDFWKQSSFVLSLRGSAFLIVDLIFYGQWHIFRKFDPTDYAVVVLQSHGSHCWNSCVEVPKLSFQDVLFIWPM